MWKIRAILRWLNIELSPFQLKTIYNIFYRNVKCKIYHKSKTIIMKHFVVIDVSRFKFFPCFHYQFASKLKPTLEKLHI